MELSSVAEEGSIVCIIFRNPHLYVSYVSFLFLNVIYFIYLDLNVIYFIYLDYLFRSCVGS